MIWDDTHTPRILTAQQRARHRASEFAPIACLNYRAEFVCDAINAEFRRSLAQETTQEIPMVWCHEEPDERPAGALTTALALTTSVCCTIAMIVGLVALVRG